MRAGGPGPVRFVALWLLVVAVCGGASWWVIERVGRDTGATAWRVPTSTATISSTSRPSLPHQSATSTPAPPNRSNPPAPAPSVAVRSFATGGGTVTASCRGAVIELRAAVPRDGYQVSQHDDDGRLEVKFVGSGEEYEVHLACRTGIPVQSD